MYGVLGEDPSDTETIKILIRRLADDASISVKTMGYEGASQMLRKGAAQLQLFSDLGCKWFVIAFDADGPDPDTHYKEVISKIVNPSGVADFCVIVPVQEIESWILADIECAHRVFKSWHPTEERYPENICSPKEYLEKLSRASNRRPRYSHATHNPRIAAYLDLKKVVAKCGSFRPLVKFVQTQSPR